MIPVFIFGCTRSGTTMLGSLLGAHELCITVPESQFIMTAVINQKINIEDINTAEAAYYIYRHKRFKDWKLKKAYNLSVDDLKSMKYADFIEKLVNAYGENHNRINPKFWIDHTPINTKYIDNLTRLFPEAKFIHLIRDGRAVAASILPLKWGPNKITRAAQWWVERLSYGLAAESYLRGRYIPVLRIKYEDVVSMPNRLLIEICKFLGVLYSDEIINIMVEGKGFQVSPSRIHQHRLVGQKPDASRIDAWKSSLRKEDIEVFESMVGDMLVYLGYEPVYGIKAKKPTRIMLNKEKILDILIRRIKANGHIIKRSFFRK